jgi:hypothetical protein
VGSRPIESTASDPCRIARYVELLPKETEKRTRNFQITTPNSCNLKIDDFSPLIERLLIDHGIEPRRLERNLDVAGS